MTSSQKFSSETSSGKASSPISALALSSLVLSHSAVSASAQSQDLIPHNHPGRESHRLNSPESPGLIESEDGVRKSLEERGISLYATYLGEVFTNHSGGIKSGSAWAGLLDVGIDLDLEKIFGWQGASFSANVFYFDGGDITGDRVGDFNAVSNLYTDTRFNFYNIFFQQAFGEADSFFKIGQIALDDDFMVSESALLFLNAGFGPLPIQTGNTAAPVYALAAPGMLLNFEPDSSYFARFGIYAGDAGPADSSNRGFDWELGSTPGWMFMAESGLTYGSNGESVIKVGGFYHTGDFERFSDGASESGLYALYAVIDHQIYSSENGTGLNAFFRGGITPQDDIATVSAYAEGGLVATDVFREGDALGLASSWSDFSDDFVDAEGGSSSEVVIEFTYQTAISDWLTIQPDVQYIINPQGGGDDAFLTGFRAEISF